MLRIGMRIARFLTFKCPPFPVQITRIIQNGQLFLTSARFVYQLAMAFIGLIIPNFYSFYRIFETLTLLLLAICSKIFIRYRPRHGHIFTGAVGIIMLFVLFEASIIFSGGESGIVFFTIYNANMLIFMDFFKYYWIMIVFEIVVNIYVYFRAVSTLLIPGSYDLFDGAFFTVFTVMQFSILFYVYITTFVLLENENQKKVNTFQSWKAMMEKLPLGIIIADKNNVLFHNMYVDDLFNYCDLTLSLSSIDTLLANSEVIGNAKHGKTIHAKSKYIFYEKQEIVYNEVRAFAYMLNDITSVYEAQQQKEEQHTLEMFVATSTHELRTPLHIIKNTLELMLDEPSNVQYEFISKSLNACEMQECYINDILDYAKMKANKLSLILEPYNIKDILKEIQGIFSTMVTETQLSFKVEFPYENLIISIDYIRFKQILFNLISNALKFTMKGGIVIKGYKLEEKAIVEVQDTGIGMTEEEVKNLFKAFGVIESTRSLNKSGTGLGLFLCKTLSSLMKSEINVKSAKSSGTSFTLSFDLLPSNIVCDSKKNVKQRNKYSKFGNKAVKISYKILIVDDNSFNCQILERMLSSLGISSCKALNGSTAMDHLKANSDIKLALLDLHMPIIDGYELMKLIQAHFKAQGDEMIKVYALTGDSTEEVKKKCQQAGFDGFLTKPFSRDAIIDIIAQC